MLSVFKNIYYIQVLKRYNEALGMDYAGVDLVPDASTPQGAQVIEVNGVAAWRGLQRVTGFDIAQALVDDLLARRLGMATAGALAQVCHF